jgi:prevent-host-death family protein
MKQVNLYEAKTRLSALVDEAAAGEEIIIAKNGKALARLIACEAAPKRPRQFGAWNQMYGYRAPESLPETTAEEIAVWEDGPVFPADDAGQPD